jgi:hypothetical protein
VNLLKAALYDPAGAVSKATSSLLAMTAFDTTNLRLAITVPAHGMVRFVLRCALEGATTFPQVLLGVMNGATVIGRVTPLVTINGTALATTRLALWADFTVTGLTPGAMNVDAAYGVEILLAATNIKYGGPNDTTTNNAWGAFVFEAWDPQPMTANGQLVRRRNGRVDVIKVAGTTQTARDLGAQLDVAVIHAAGSDGGRAHAGRLRGRRSGTRLVEHRRADDRAEPFRHHDQRLAGGGERDGRRDAADHPGQLDLRCRHRGERLEREGRLEYREDGLLAHAGVPRELRFALDHRGRAGRRDAGCGRQGVEHGGAAAHRRHEHRPRQGRRRHRVQRPDLRGERGGCLG